jgi:hypothetical protein
LANGRPAPDSDAIRAALARILDSPSFAPPRLKAFLRFVAENTLDGRADAIKGYTIGTLVFRRPDGFDPSIDPIVRVEAVRLRTALARYYEGEGIDDPVVISIPAGGYVPKFTFRDTGNRDKGNTADPVRLAPRVGGSIGRALQERNGDMARFRDIVARMRQSIADFDTEIMVSRFIIAQSESIVERDQDTGPGGLGELGPGSGKTGPGKSGSGR